MRKEEDEVRLWMTGKDVWGLCLVERDALKFFHNCF